MNQRKLLHLTGNQREKYLHAKVFVLAFLFFCVGSNAQKPLPRVRSHGIMTGYGNAVHTTVSRYKIFYFTGDFSQSFSRAYKVNFLGYFFEPQFNVVHAMEESWDIEFGLNGGIRNYIRVNPGLYFYQMLGSGPHYISASLPKQARGFIFSDNLSAGFYKKINKKFSFLNVQFRIRHISNLNLKLPNRGVNSYNFLIGLTKIK